MLRLAGGLFPLFAQDAATDKLGKLIANANNKSAGELFDFHKALTTDKPTYTRVRKYMSAPNPSLPNNITHGKFLMLLSLLQGYVLEEEERKNLLTIHHKVFADGFYAARLGPLAI